MTLDIEHIEALCFDVDGTLSDTDDQFVQNLVQFFQPVRFLFPGRDSRPLARKIVMATETPANFLYGIPDRLGIDDELSAAGEYLYQRGLGKSPQPFALISGVRELLLDLRDRYPMAVVSARGDKSTRRFLNQFNLKSFFKVVVTAQTCSHTKPYPDPILYAAEFMGVPPERCLMIGDTTVDIRAAQAAGAQSAGVLCGFGTEKELRRVGADLILGKTAELSEILKGSHS
jgi:phosphoglycolate phosphatase-like HAD superfamily hydrolase